MDQPYLGAIFIWAGTFAPRGYAFCQGQILGIQQNTALFSILGTTYGGNGTTTFALPNLCGRAPFGAGVPAQGTGLNPLTLGEVGGHETVTLTQNNMPLHNHTATSAQVSTAPATLTTPVDQSYLGVVGGSRGTAAYVANGSQGTTVNLGGSNVAIGNAGGSQPFDIHPPYLALNFIIATEGLYPPRN